MREREREQAERDKGEDNTGGNGVFFCFPITLHESEKSRKIHCGRK